MRPLTSTAAACASLFAGCVLAAALAFGVAWAALTFPALTGRVTDAANILSPEVRASLTRKLADLEAKSSIQLVVATVPSLGDGDIETYANSLFRAWKLGEAKRNNGALLVVAPTERKVRVEVGYGLEGVITDALSSVIIQSAMIPRFKAGDFSGGVDRGVDALISAMTDDQSEWHKRVRVRHDEDSGLAAWMPFIFFALFVFIVYMQMRNSRRGIGRRGGPIFIPGGWGGGSSGGSSWGGSSGGSSWGGGDGGFSGGGGSSGGGGASGSW